MGRSLAGSPLRPHIQLPPMNAQSYNGPTGPVPVQCAGFPPRAMPTARRPPCNGGPCATRRPSAARPPAEPRPACGQEAGLAAARGRGPQEGCSWRRRSRPRPNTLTPGCMETLMPSLVELGQNVWQCLVEFGRRRTDSADIWPKLAKCGVGRFRATAGRFWAAVFVDSGPTLVDINPGRIRANFCRCWANSGRVRGKFGRRCDQFS